MAIKANPATGNINASGRATAAEFAAQSVSAYRVGSGALVEQTMPTTESSSKPISITGIVQWVRGLIGGFYTKPSGGIPKSDLVPSVQNSLNKADVAQPKIDDLNTIRERARTGNEHAGIKDGNPHNTKFSDLVAKPTTLTGYGVTAADPATVSAEGGADDNKAADAVKTKQYVEYMVGSNTARFQGEFATADDIPTDVTQYATKTAPTNNDYIVVRDMSEYGKTGNLFSAIDAEVGSINANGVIDTAMTNFSHTTILPLSGKDGWHIHLKATGVGGSAMFRLHAYRSDGSWNGQIAVAQSAGGMVELRGLVPYGTEGFRVSYLNGSSVTVFAHEREGSWRWIYTGEWSMVGKNGWSQAFQMSSEPFTPAQLEAINSGATEDKIEAIDRKQDALDPTQLANIADVQNKRDKSDMFTEWVPGEDAPQMVGQPVREPDLTPGYSYLEWYDNDGVRYRTSSAPDELLDVDVTAYFASYSREFIATRSRILTTADVTDDLTNPPVGKAADAKKVGESLAGKRDKNDNICAVGTICEWTEAIIDNPGLPTWYTQISVSGEYIFLCSGAGPGYQDDIIDMVVCESEDQMYARFQNANVTARRFLIATGLESFVTKSGVQHLKAGGLVPEAVAALKIPTETRISQLAEAAVEDKITTEDASLVALIKKYGGTQIKEDEKGFYYEVEEA